MSARGRCPGSGTATVVPARPLRPAHRPADPGQPCHRRTLALAVVDDGVCAVERLDDVETSVISRRHTPGRYGLDNPGLSRARPDAPTGSTDGTSVALAASRHSCMGHQSSLPPNNLVSRTREGPPLWVGPITAPRPGVHNSLSFGQHLEEQPAPRRSSSMYPSSSIKSRSTGT